MALSTSRLVSSRGMTGFCFILGRSARGRGAIRSSQHRPGQRERMQHQQAAGHAGVGGLDPYESVRGHIRCWCRNRAGSLAHRRSF